MKRISRLLLAATICFVSAGEAKAVDIKTKGQFEFGFGWGENINTSRADRRKGFDSRNANDSFLAQQRFRPQIDFIASEALRGVLMFEIGDTIWGRQSQGGALDADGVNVETRRAYMDWIVPSTDLAVRMGIQGLALPSATKFNSPVFAADVAGITVSNKFNNMFALTGFWARPFDATSNDGDENYSDEMDMFGLVAPITGTGWSVTPWGVVSSIGNSSGFMEYMITGPGRKDLYGTGGSKFDYTKVQDSDSSIAWWAGSAFELNMFAPLTFALDVMHGDTGEIDLPQFAQAGFFDGNDMRFRGWFLDARLDYKFDWVTAGLFGWWSTGDDASDVENGHFGRMPVVGTDAGFKPTSFGFAGKSIRSYDRVIGHSGVGTWGIGAQLAKASFIEDVNHTLRVAYYRGTNDIDAVQFVDKVGGSYHADSYLTTKDSAWEVNFDHQYKIYQNLTTYLEFAYINLDVSERNSLMSDHDDAWKAQVGFKFDY